MCAKQQLSPVRRGFAVAATGGGWRVRLVRLGVALSDFGSIEVQPVRGQVSPGMGNTVVAFNGFCGDEPSWGFSERVCALLFWGDCAHNVSGEG